MNESSSQNGTILEKKITRIWKNMQNAAKRASGMRSERKMNMNPITRTLNVDNLLLLALQEDISSEDVTTNAVMPKACQGTVQLLC